MSDYKKLAVIKYGGNAMINDEITTALLENMAELSKKGYKIVIVHGGGPFIKNTLKMAGIESEFVGGHRKTDSKSIKYIEMALKGEVNGKLVRKINNLGLKAVGLSGKDGKLATAVKRYHKNEKQEEIDLGQVGDVEIISPGIINLLLDNDFIPVVTSVATGKDGKDYNINADMFAGHLAGALNADKFIMLTDVDGLMEDPSRPETIINEIKINDINELVNRIIKGGMIPKTEACKIALENGAGSAMILNGTKPEQLMKVFKNADGKQGTKFLK